MPNGIMTGDGSPDSPYIVMDGYDFNALRNISTSSASFKYVELGADISLGMYSNFVPIPECYFNIDGKNHSITEITVTTAYAALFTKLHCVYIKDLILEGEVTGTNQSGAALLAYTLVGRSATISNVQCFGTVTGNSTGGMALILDDDTWSASSTIGTTNILQCSFKGKINFNPTYVSTSLNSSTPYAGGLVGNVNPSSFRGNFLFKNCIVLATISLSNYNGNTFTAGIFAYSYYGNSTYLTTVTECVVKITFIVGGTTNSSYSVRYGGLMGYFCPYQNDSQINAFLGSKNAVHTKIILNGVHALVAGGLTNTYTSSSVANRTALTQCYAVIELDANGYDTGNVHIDGISRSTNYAVSNCLWDREALEATYTKYAGSYLYAGADTTTANLKNADFLRSKGWDI